MAIEIEILESSKELLSGIPESLSIVSIDNIVFYYTLDGEDPSLDSLVADEVIYMPTGGASVELKVIGFREDEDTGELVQVTDIFGKKYYSDSYSNSISRHSYDSGIIVLPYGKDSVDNLSVSFDGSAAQETAIEMSELDIKASVSSRSGENIPNDSTISFIRKPIRNRDLPSDRKTSYANSIDFDPRSNVIEIDGRDQASIDSQVVKIVNRSYGSIRPTSKFYDENWKRDEQVITGNLVRSIYNRSTGIIVFYYWDSKESKWLMSRQNIGPAAPYNISQGSSSGRGGRLVYRWIQERSFTRIF